MKKHFIKKDVFIFMIGLTVCCYPIISNYLEQIRQSNQISTYENNLGDLNKSEVDEMIENAIKWNENLLIKQKGIAIVDELKYEDMLEISNGVIGSIEIPKIDVNMPIYHSVDDNALSVGAGHLEDSSLPIGGKSTHAALTGHRGLPSSKLFTRLDELIIGDLFYLNVLNSNLAYIVDKIQVLSPDQVRYEIEDGKDLVTLITCTPYGINTERLVITGYRVDYQEDKKNSIDSKLPSVREIVFYILPLFLSFIGILVFKKRKG